MSSCALDVHAAWLFCHTVTSYFLETFATLRSVKCSGSINMASFAGYNKICANSNIYSNFFIVQQCIIPCHHSTKAERWSTSADGWARRWRCTTRWVEQNESKFWDMYYTVLLSNFAMVIGHPQEAHGGPGRQSSSSRQLSPLPQRKQDAREVSQQQPQHSM